MNSSRSLLGARHRRQPQAGATNRSSASSRLMYVTGGEYLGHHARDARAPPAPPPSPAVRGTTTTRSVLSKSRSSLMSHSQRSVGTARSNRSKAGSASARSFMHSSRSEGSLAASARSATRSARQQSQSQQRSRLMPPRKVSAEVRHDEVYYKHSLALRNYRADLLKIRDRFHHYTGSKFKDIRSLFSRLDRDHDGKVSMKEWVLGLQDLNFPITEGEAVKMFRAIDVNNDNGLEYREIVNVLAPQSLTSIATSRQGSGDRTLQTLKGFITFTTAQAQLAHDDVNAQILDAAMRNEQERAKTERELHSELEKNLTVAERLQLRNAARAEACNPNLWRKPQWRFPSEAHKMEDLKNTILEQFDARAGSAGARMLRLFRIADEANVGYLDKEAFKNLLGLRGLNLQLTPEQLDMLAHEVADDNGAVEPKAFTKFLARSFVREPDTIDESRRRMMETLDKRVLDELKARPHDAPRWPRKQSYEAAHAATARASLHTGRSATSTRSRGGAGAGGGAGGGTRRSPVRPRSQLTAPRSPLVTAGGSSFAAAGAGDARAASSRASRGSQASPTVRGNVTSLQPRSPATSQAPEDHDAGPLPSPEVSATKLSASAARMIADLESDGHAMPGFRPNMKPRQRIGETMHLTQPPKHTAAFASEFERFDRGAANVGMHSKAIEHQRMFNRAAASRVAQDRIRDTYALEQRMREEKERRRVASKCAQQLRYYNAVLGNNVGRNPVTQSAEM